MRPAVGVILAVAAFWHCGAHADCTLTNTGDVPLPDMGFQLYQGFPGGLYPNSVNNYPPAHLAVGMQIATNQIQPLDATGNINTNSGKIVLLSIGLSNTTQEWASKGTENFRALANADSSKNPRVLIVDGAQGGQASTDWTNFNSPTWTNVELRLTAAGATTNQVEVIWLKSARRQPSASGAFPLHAQALEADLEIILRHCQRRYPNLKIAYVSNRTRSYEDTPSALNPEPYAYESSFSVKWLIEKQINGDAGLNFDPAKGAVMSPWVAWGPYLWADGTVARSDGFVWLCSDLESDFTHPSPNGGVPKVARHLMALFKTDPAATPWFLRKTVTNQPPVCAPSASATNGVIPLTVSFAANASDPDGSIRDIFWTFDDGTFSTNANPVKIFKGVGSFEARVTVTDNDGNTVTRLLPITVAALALGNPALIGGNFHFDVLGATNYDYVVQRSDALTNWISVITNHGPFTFGVSNLSSPQTFYRALLKP